MTAALANFEIVVAAFGVLGIFAIGLLVWLASRDQG